MLAAVPLVYLGVRIAEAGPDGVLAVLGRRRLPGLLLNSVLLAAAVTLSATALGVTTALVLTRVRLPAPRWWATVAVLPMAVPSYLAAFGWVGVLPGASGFWPSWWVLTCVTTPYVTLPVAAALRGESAELAAVARTLGHGPVTVFRTATWPVVRGPVLAGGLLVCLYVLADFGGVALFRHPVLTTAIHQAYGASFDRNYAAVLAGLLVLLALVVFTAERRWRPERQPEPSRTGARPVADLGRWLPVPMLVLLIAPVGAVVVPLGSLLRRLWSAQTVRELDLVRLAEAVGTTLAVAVAGALVALLLALPIATLAARHPGRVARVLDTLGALPLAVPGIVMGLGLVFFALTALPALYQTSAMLVFGYGLLFMPKAIGILRAAVERVPRAWEGVAATLGYGPVTRWWRVVARSIRPALVVAGLLVAVTAMKELPATLMLRPTGTRTLAVELWSTTDASRYGAAVPYALALVLLAAVPSVLAFPRADKLGAGTEQ